MNAPTHEPATHRASASAVPSGPPTSRKSAERETAGLVELKWTTGLFSLAALVVLTPFWAPLVLAAWLAIVASPLCQRIARRFHARSAAPAMLTVVLVLAVLLPLGGLALSLTATAVELFQNLQHSKSAADALRTLTSGSVGLPMQAPNPGEIFELVRTHASGALNALRVVFGAVTQAVIGLIVFVAGFFIFLQRGAGLYTWIIERSPLEPQHSRRLGDAFAETGRGLLIGIGLTALLQAAVATIGYLVSSVPQAFVLGLLTVIAALIPTIGSALIWVPVTAGLFMVGRTTAGVVMLAIGCCASTIDNLARPVLSRFGKLNLNAFLLFLAMLGGIGVFGAWGLLLGPLSIRLAIEGLDILREARRH